MTLLLLDTTFLIDAERSGSGLDAAIGDDDDVAVAAITIAELLVGVELAAKQHKAARHDFVEAIAGNTPFSLALFVSKAGLAAPTISSLRRRLERHSARW